MKKKTILTILLVLAACIEGVAQPDIWEAARGRRARVMQAMDDGILIVQSTDRSQPNLYEFFVDDTESHDFTYLTGLDHPTPPGSVLVLNPSGETHREILYTADDIEFIKQVTGLEHVFPHSQFIEDLSSAITDFRNLRITQLRFKPIASDLARGLGDDRKVIYLNYPRFTNLNEPSHPRFAFVSRLREASPEIEMRDAGDLLDRLRMIQDEYGLAQLRRAVEITGKGLMEAMKLARPGLTTKQVMETADYIYRLNGARLGFPTSVSSGPPDHRIVYTNAREEMEARSGSRPIESGDLVHFDTGAEHNYYSADVQRVVPADGTFTEKQRRIYDKVVEVQETVIRNVRPGATWWELHNLAVKMLKEAGGWDESYTYGIGHFIGMDVHEHGDYLAPYQPGMVLAIEQGVVVDGIRVAFEDDVLVTTDGYEWLTEFIPLRADDVERLRREPPRLEPEKLLLEPR